MALIKCNECGQMISDKADKCPHCGCPISYNNNTVDKNNNSNTKIAHSKPRKNVLIKVIAFLLAIAVGGCMCFYLINTNNIDPNAIVEITPEFSQKLEKYSEKSSFSNGLSAVMSKDNGKWGYIDTKGDEVIPCVYDEAFEFSYEGLALVVKDEKYGYIDREGEVAIDFKYGIASSFSDGIAIVSDKSPRQWSYPPIYFINPKGETITELSKENIRGSVEEYGETCECVLNTNIEKGIISSLIWGIGDEDDVDWDKGWFYMDTKGNILDSSPTDETQEYSHILGDGGEIFDKNGNLLASFPNCDFELDGYPRFEDSKKYGNLKINNGVLLATMYHFSDKWEERFTIYGYVDLQGNSTFSQNDINRINEANAKREEAIRLQREEEERRKREGTEFIITLSAYNKKGRVYNPKGSHGAYSYYVGELKTKRIYIPDDKVWIFKEAKFNGDIRDCYIGIADAQGFIHKNTRHDMRRREMFSLIGGIYIQAVMEIPSWAEGDFGAEFTFIEKDKEYY